ncbi:unnamed protein product [Rhizophagus irregularis]|nr:unnamed protein product [Rhizophagus irregularis]CAB4421292.1 unnamed protein product [Rhizophagus irregularis]
MEFINEIQDIIRKYRKTEPVVLVSARATALFILVAILGGYFAILTALIALDKGIMVSQLQPAEIIPVPDVEITFNYHFNITCEVRYLDGKTPTPCDEDLVTQPSCDQNSEDQRWHGWFTSIDGRLKYNMSEKLYGVYFTINIDDPRYLRENDAGMFVKVHDSDFNPRTVPQRVHDQALKLDPNFYAKLDELNYHVIGFQQINWMFINRHIKKKMITNFFSVLGFPPTYFEEPYLTSKYESVTAPDTIEFAGQPITGQQKYANLFIGTLNWFQEVETESRTRRILDSISMLAGFYGILAGLYVLIFGFSPIRPWGIFQNCCIRRRVKNELHKQYPKSIPLLELPSIDETITERINYLEQFLSQHVCDIDYMKVIKGEKDIEEAENVEKDVEREIFEGESGKDETTDDLGSHSNSNRRGGKKFNPFLD